MLNQKIHHYIITRLIGEGGMASVYEAMHEKLQTKVAIKVLNPMLAANSNIRQRFENEARFMASLTHPNITRVIDYEERPDLLAIILEFLEGKDLNVMIRKNGPMPLNEALTCFTQVLDAFDYAHRKGIIHRDVKPSNIFIEPGNIVKILDFGIAKLIGNTEDMTMTGTQMGTPVYMSPEQVNTDKTLDHRSDIYSLGVTLYYMLKGEPPYDATTTSSFQIYTKIVHEPLPELGKYPDIEKVIRKATDKDRNLRYQTCMEFRKALLEAAEPKKAEPEKTVFVAPADSEKTLIDIPEPAKKEPVPPVAHKKAVKPPEPAKEKPSGAKKTRNMIITALGILGVLIFMVLKFYPSLFTDIFGGNKEARRAQALHLVDLGKAQFKNEIMAGAYDSAVFYLKKAVKLDPASPDAKFYLGHALYRLTMTDSADFEHLTFNQMELSSQAFEDLLRIKPDYLSEAGLNDPYTALSAVWGSLAMKYMIKNVHDSVMVAFREGKLRGGFNEVILENARNILNSCDRDAILFLRWDIVECPVLYLQETENLRKDVKVVNPVYLKEDYYFNYLNNTLGISFSFGSTWLGLMTDKPWAGQYVVAENIKTGTPFTWWLPGNESQKLSVIHQVMLDIITSNKFSVPVNFSAFYDFSKDALGLYQYLVPEGLVYKLKTEFFAGRGTAQQQKMNSMSFTEIKNSKIPSTDLRIVIDYIRNEYLQLITAFNDQNNTTAAKAVLKEMENNLPFDNYPAYFDAVRTKYESFNNILEYTPEQRKVKEQEKIREYMSKNGLTGTPSASGVYYIETKSGTGPATSLGSKIKVHYTGKLLDGTKFDSSYDRNEPIEFELGAGQVIRGWEDSFWLRQAGSKAILIIPSDQGYGSREMPNMPAYSILVFEVEIVAVN